VRAQSDQTINLSTQWNGVRQQLYAFFLGFGPEKARGEVAP
jgi:hypothetical protein